jgi:hypothetical protein
MLDMTAMKELLQRGGPMATRKAAGFLMADMGLSERRSCRIAFSRTARVNYCLPRVQLGRPLSFRQLT